MQRLLPIDQTLDWADPLGSACVGQPPVGTCGSIYLGPQPAVPHLHGGEVAPAYDGGPDPWWLPVNAVTGVVGSGSPAAPGAGQAQFIYPTQQQAGTIWFHDHALGITRLNVYAGMAGLYIITDPPNEPIAGVLPAFPQHDIPLFIQDRSFDVFGQIFLEENPATSATIYDSTSRAYNLDNSSLLGLQMAGQVDGAVYFNTELGRWFGTSSANNITTQDVTISAWIKTDETSVSRGLL